MIIKIPELIFLEIDSDLKTEINNKIEGDLKQFLLALIEVGQNKTSLKKKDIKSR